MTAWTLMVAGFLCWNLHDNQRQTISLSPGGTAKGIVYLLLTSESTLSVKGGLQVPDQGNLKLGPAQILA